MFGDAAPHTTAMQVKEVVPSHARLQKTWATNDVITASDMNELHTDPLQGDVATSQSTTSTSYTDLTTSGPAQTKTLVNGQKVLVVVSAQLSVGAATDEAFMSFAVSGASTLAANDANSCHQRDAGGNQYKVLERTTVFTASAGGSHTFTAKYKFANGGGASSASFADRRIIVKPF